MHSLVRKVLLLQELLQELFRVIFKHLVCHLAQFCCGTDKTLIAIIWCVFTILNVLYLYCSQMSFVGRQTLSKCHLGVVNQVKVCYWKQRRNQTRLWSLKGEIRIIYFFLTHWVIVKYAIYKYVSLASKFELPYISIPCITGTANSVYETLASKLLENKLLYFKYYEGVDIGIIISTERATVMIYFYILHFIKLSYPAWNTFLTSKGAKCQAVNQSRKHATVCFDLRGYRHNYVRTLSCACRYRAAPEMWYLRVKIHAHI